MPNDSLFPIADNKLFYSIKEVQVMLGVSRATVYRVINADELELVKIGGRSLIPKEGLCRFMHTLKPHKLMVGARCGSHTGQKSGGGEGVADPFEAVPRLRKEVSWSVERDRGMHRRRSIRS